MDPEVDDNGEPFDELAALSECSDSVQEKK
jgi:hypothetical protein